MECANSTGKCRDMDYRQLGGTGLKISPLVLGTNNFADPTSEADSIAMVEKAIDAGINLIDTADSYASGESERYIGKALKRNGLRDKVLLATKVFYPTGPGPNDKGNSRKHIMRACEDSLRRMQIDHIDIYQLHRPDPSTPIEETLFALNDLVETGKVRYVACSTFPAWQVMEAVAISDRYGIEKFCLEQPPYNLLDRRIENELLPVCRKYGLGVLAWAPMAQGMLLGRYTAGQSFPTDSRAAMRGGIYEERIRDSGIRFGDRFVELANDAGISPARLAILWAKDQPGITAPIIGPRTLAQLEDLLPVADMFLTDDLRLACDRLVPPGTAVADFHNTADWMRMRIE